MNENFMETEEVLDMNMWENDMPELDKLSITFTDDDKFMQLANERKLIEQNDESLRARVDKLIQDDDDLLPRNESVRKTLHILRQQYGLIVDTSPDSLSDLVVRVMNRTLQSSFSFEFAGNTFALPPSRLLLRRLAQVVEARIVVVSTRARTLVFAPDKEPRSPVVLVHLADSFQSISTYCSLTCSVTEPTRNLIAPVLELPEAPETVGKAIYRDQRRSTSRKKIAFSTEDAEKSFLSSCDETLRGRVNTAVSKAFDKSNGKKKAQSDKSAALEKGYGEFFSAECGLKRLPRGVVQNAISNLEISLKEKPGWISHNDFRQHMNLERTHAMYRDFVQDKCRLFWEGAVSNKIKTAERDVGRSLSHVQGTASQSQVTTSQAEEAASQGQETPSEKDHIRVCDVPLRRILRDFDDLGTTIEDILERKQREISDHMEELQMAIFKTTTEVFRGLLHETSQDVNISDILPADFAIRDNGLRKDPTVKVATLTSGFLERLFKTGDDDGKVDADLSSVFGQGCLQYLAARLCPSSASSEPPLKKAKNERGYGEHPVWDSLARYIQETIAVNDSAVCPQGMAFTRNEMLRTMATNINNLWSGNIYGDVKRAVVRYLVRLFLRPLSEEWYRKLKRQKAKERKERMAAKRAKVRQRRRKRYWRRAASLLNQLDRAVVTCAVRWTGDTLWLAEPTTRSASRIIKVQKLHKVQKLLKLLRQEGGEEMDEDDDGDDSIEDENDERIEDEDEDEDEDGEVWEADDADGFDEAVEVHNISTSAQNSETSEKEAARKAEPKSKHLKGLEAVICKLIDDSELPENITEDEFRSHLFSDHKFKECEIQVATRIVNSLRPFAPKKDSSGSIPRHILVSGPFVYLANQLLFAMGYSDFARRLSPLSSAGKLLPLPLNATGISEVLCNEEAHHFDVYDSTGLLVSDQKHAPKNPFVIFQAFFDMPAIHAACSNFGLRFAERLVFVDRHTVRVMGYEMRQNPPRNMIKVKRKKSNKSRTKYISDADRRQAALHELNLSKAEAKARAEALDSQISEVDKEIQSINRQLAQQEYRLKATKFDLRELKAAKRDEDDIDLKCSLDENINDTFTIMKSQRTVVHQLRLKVLPMRDQIKNLRQQKYDHLKYDPAWKTRVTENIDSTATPVFTSSPSLFRPGCLDSVKSINIDALKQEIDQNNGDLSKRNIVLVPGGTDPGACVLFNTVPLPQNTLIKLHNRFELLSNNDYEQEEEAQSIDDIRFPDPYQVTVQQIRHHSGLTKQARVRKKRIASNTGIKKAHKDLAHNSIHHAATLQAINEAQEVRRESCTVLRSFERSNKMKNLRRHTELSLRHTYDRVAADERKAFKKVVTVDNLLQTTIQEPAPSPCTTGFCADCGYHHLPEFSDQKNAPRGQRRTLKHLEHCPRVCPVVIPLMLHGDAGSGVGSRLKGRAKMGGTIIPERHMRYNPVCKTPEYKSSQVCPFCFSLVRLVRAKREKNGTTRMVRVHGAVQCVNPACISFQLGYADRGRDTNAAVNIALSGFVQLASAVRKTLPPFDPTCPSWSLPANTRSFMSGTPNLPLAPERDAKIAELSIRSTYSQ